MSVGADPISSYPGSASGGSSTRLSRRAMLLIAVLVVFPLFVVIAYFASQRVLGDYSVPPVVLNGGNSPGVQGQVLFSTTTQGGNLSATPPPSGAEPFGSSILFQIPPVNFLGLLLGLALVVAIFVAIRGLRTTRERIVPFEDLGVNDRREKVAAVLEVAASRLRTGSSFRETVIECYTRVSGLLEERSEVKAKALTAREFQSRVTQELRLDTPYLRDLTELFELARYSDEEITATQSEDAVRCFSRLGELLREEVPDAKGEELSPEASD